jgi:hypothetical protein
MLLEDDSGDGCNNEAIRIFSNTGRANWKVNQLTSGNSWTHESSYILDDTLQNMKHCVLGISERCEETAEAIKHHYPWFSSFNCSVVLNRGEISSTKPIPSNIQAEVEKQNALEILAYRFANEVLDVQLQEIGYTHSRR